jgi:outer membrane lipoprotein-sorting protein
VSGPRRLSSLLLVVALLAGCATIIPAARQPIPEEARRAISLLVDRWHAFSDLRALADIVIERGSDRQQFHGVLLVKAPRSFRFEALSPFGQPFLFLTIHDGEMRAFDAATNEAMVGPATAETTARLLSLPVEPDDLVAVFSGRAVPPQDLRTARVLPPDEQGPSLYLLGRSNEQRVWMNFDTGVVHQLEIVGGSIEARVVYLRDDMGALTGFDVSARSYVKGTVRYKSVVVDGGIEPERFTLTVPHGAKVQTIR